MAKVYAKKEAFVAERLKNGYTLESLAEKTGLTKETIFRIESGRGVRPKNAAKICAALNLAFDDLFSVQEG